MLTRWRVVAVLSVLLGSCGLGAADASVPTPSGVVVYTFERSTGASGAWLEAANLDGSSRRLLTPIPSLKTQRFDTLPRLSPDGTMVAFVRHGNRSGNLLYVVNADGSDLRVVAGPDQVITLPMDSV